MTPQQRTGSVAEQLKKAAGVEPSRRWLDDCVAELSLQGGAHTSSSSSSAADAALYQVLHHDLRDVVERRRCGGSSSSSSANGSAAAATAPTTAAQLLRDAVRRSRSGSSGCKAQLPSSFKLLVQVEELLDVSKNVETRLSHGPASRNAPSAVGNQNGRCLKLLLSDGYSDEDVGTSNGGGVENRTINGNNISNESSNAFVAMEITPIQSLSVNSLAGIKVVLSGPIDVRHGVLLLHEGNTVVLGGHVPDLVQIQAKAIEQAKKQAGVGIDPTVRALIGNSFVDDGFDAQDDEGMYCISSSFI